MSFRRRLTAVYLVLVAVSSAAVPAGAEGMENENRRRAALAPRTPGQDFVGSSVDCDVAVRTDELHDGVNLDCDGPRPNNEPHVAVNPVDPRHILVTSNDFDSCCDQFYTSLNGGRRWTTGNMSGAGARRVGSDPVSSFDPRRGTVLHASLSFAVGSAGESGDGDVVVSVSDDGGVTWDRPVVVADGWGFDGSADQVFNDKPWLVTDRFPKSKFYGRSYLVWTRFKYRSGKYLESPIWFASSDDGGRSWTRPTEISGQHGGLCPAGTRRSTRCNGSHAPSIAVGPDGAIAVAYVNTNNPALAENGDGDRQYLVVRSTDGGATFSAPSFVVGLEDGARDYPRNVDGRATLSGTQVRLAFPGSGNLASNPQSGELFLVFSDNRAGRRSVDPPETDTNVYVMTSPDGKRWRGPEPVATGPGDQWQPAADVDPTTGGLAVLYYDGNEGGSGRYGVSLARRTRSSGKFLVTSVAPQSSDLRESRFFRAAARGCPRCTTFFGDYLSIAYGADGALWAAWTDMRDVVRFRGRAGRSQHIFVRRLGPTSADDGPDSRR